MLVLDEAIRLATKRDKVIFVEAVFPAFFYGRVFAKDGSLGNRHRFRAMNAGKKLEEGKIYVYTTAGGNEFIEVSKGN